MIDDDRLRWNHPRTGFSPGPGLRSAPRLRPLVDPDVDWAPGPEASLPAVADGVVYLADGTGAVWAVDMTAGDAATPGGAAGGGEAVAGSAVAGGEAARDDGAAAGRLVWHWPGRVDLDEPDLPRAADAQTPALTPDLVIVATIDGIRAHSRTDGEPRWENEDCGGWPVVVGDTLVVVSAAPDSIVGYDIGTGQRRWSVDRGADGSGLGLLQTRPTIAVTRFTGAGGLVLVAEGYEPHRTHGGLHAINSVTGNVVWSVGESTDECLVGQSCDEDRLMPAPFHPVYAGGLVWVWQERWCEVLIRELIAIDPDTGQECRILTDGTGLGAGGGDEVMHAAPVFGDLVFLRGESALHALDTSGVIGVLRWSRDLGEPMIGPPVLAGSVLHVATAGGGLHALDAATGEPCWSHGIAASGCWEPEVREYNEQITPFVLADGALYVLTDDGPFVAR